MKHGCSVFVGNIDFDVDEKRVVEELSAVGRVISFRMVYDKATGKSKGYGFCEYESPLIAEAAMKTLKISFNGRPLKINYAENDIPTKPQESEIKPLQIDSIIASLDELDSENLKNIMMYLKKMAIEQPTRLKELLRSYPNLMVAVLAALMKLKLIDNSKVESVIKNSFEPHLLKDQIVYRVKNMGDSELAALSDDVKYRLNRMKGMLLKRDQAESS